MKIFMGFVLMLLICISVQNQEESPFKNIGKAQCENLLNREMQRKDWPITVSMKAEKDGIDSFSFDVSRLKETWPDAWIIECVQLIGVLTSHASWKSHKLYFLEFGEKVAWILTKNCRYTMIHPESIRNDLVWILKRRGN
ncbi:hypothetical protein ES707_13615 [subsurface metagenome]